VKILLAAHSLAGLAGAPLHTLDLCRGFRRAGHEISAFTFYTGTVTDLLGEEGISVFTPQDSKLLENEAFDIVYLYHATCEALLGLVFAGRTPIVRGYIGKGSTTAAPINADFSSGVTYISEGVREAMQRIGGWNSAVPSRIARNVYDDGLVERGVDVSGPPRAEPSFALVSNHVPTGLGSLLKEAAGDRRCRFTHFGQPDNSLLVTPELLDPFDAVITIGRTVPLAAALGKPVYLCDIHGIEGWLVPDNYHGSRVHSFSGRRSTVKDWGVVEHQLLETHRWPEAEELTWIRDQIELDHALSRRVIELESFFAEILREAAPPVTPPDGHRAVFRLLVDESGSKTPGRKHGRRKRAERLNAVEERAARQASQLEATRQRLEETGDQLARCRERLRESDRKLQEERATTRSLRQEGASLSGSIRRAWSRAVGYLGGNAKR
jgi:hypothetical protein